VRVAVADVGSNSTRLLVADVEDGRLVEELEHQSIVTRLGAGVDSNGALSDEGIQRVYETLDEYVASVERHGTDKRIAVLTSAVRDAANGGDFANSVRERYGFAPHVLSGDDEAQLTYLGAMSERDPEDRTPTLVIDIGGGSTELITGAGRQADFHLSTQAGVVRQTERHLHHDPPLPEELEALSSEVREIVAGGVPESRRSAIRRAIGVAGTATQLASIAQGLEPYDPKKVHGYVLAAKQAREILGRLAAVGLEERKETRGLDPDRAPTIVAGVEILLVVLELVGLSEVEVSEHDILRGAALGLS
jgi:exopolyphosphatase / guanosine-5'-triphosphate,3'-diphosphate pyrophosphatase